MPNTHMQAGVSYPTVSAMSGASARSSAINSQAGANNKLNLLNSVTKGGAVVVPQISGSYTQQNGTQGPNAQIKTLTATGGQQYQNSVYDAGALKKGGKSKTFGKRIGKTFDNRMDNRMVKRINKTFGNKRMDNKRINNKRFDNKRMDKTKKRIYKKRNRTKL